MKNFSTIVKRHLTDYKKERLQIFEDGLDGSKRAHHKYILPKQYERLNIIETYRKEFWEHFNDLKIYDIGEISLHRGFHHLNSSQAMCFNLFYPYVNELLTDIRYNDVEFIRHFLSSILNGLDTSTLNLFADKTLFSQRFDFEKVFDKKEGTNFDFYLEFENGIRILFEIKYTESDFGDFSKDNITTQNSRFDSIYKSKLMNIVNEKYHNFDDIYRKHYQVLRNLSYIDKNTCVIFLYPEQNDKLQYFKNELFGEIILPKYQRHVKVIYLEDFIEKIISNDKISNNLKCHYSLFKEKYILDELHDYNYFTNIEDAEYFNRMNPNIVERFDYGYRYLKTFPSEVLNFKKLKTLDLQENEFEEIPDGIWDMTSLEELTIDIQKSPDKIGNLKKLKYLHLTGSGVDSLPKSIENLKHLENLVLGFGDIKQLPDEITKLTALEKIDLLSLSNLDLKDTFIKLSTLPNLKCLSLEFNHLHELPHEITLLKNLESLDLSLNKLSKIPSFIYKMKTLERLNIACNDVDEIEPAICNLENLEILNIEFTKIEKLPEEINSMKRLRRILTR